jgi:hypothetical protein
MTKLDHPKVDQDGTITCDTPGSINLFALESMVGRLRIEAAGMRFRVNTGPVAKRLLKEAGREAPRDREKLAEAFRAYVDDLKKEQLGAPRDIAG